MRHRQEVLTKFRTKVSQSRWQVPIDGVGLRDKLAAPLDQVLFFAGEATNRDNSGYVHGALESGFRAADEVIG